MDERGDDGFACAASRIAQRLLDFWVVLARAPLGRRLAICVLVIAASVLARGLLSGVLDDFSGHYLFYPAIFISASLCGTAGGLAAVALILLFAFSYLEGGAERDAHNLWVLGDFLVDAAVYIALARLPPYLARMLRDSDDLARINAEQFGHFIEQAPAAMAMFDREMRYIAVSARWREDFDLDRDVVGKSHYDVFPETPEEWKEIHRRALAGESARCEQDEFSRADGVRQWLRWEVRPWMERPDCIGGVVIFAEDITDRVRIQEALQENERRLSAMFGAAMDAIVTTDRSGLILSANPAANDMVGFEGADLIGRNVGVLMPENHSHDHVSLGAASIDNGFWTIIGRRRTVEGQRRNGEVFPLELTVSEAQAADGPVFFGVMRDLSPIEAERRRVNVLRDELAHVSRLNDMGEMVAGLAHEVAQPVAAILNFSAAYRRALATTGKAPEADLIGKIEDQARRAAEILKRLRGFIEKRPPERRAVGIESLIDDALKLLTLRSRPRLLRPPSPDELAGARICVDPIQIEQVLVNLLRNADDALIDTAAPEIVIETSLAAPGRLKVNVGDNGAGVDAEVVAELFDPFFTTKHFGMGMGLSISRGIVESHGGTIGYRPNAPCGSIFEFELPIYTGDGDGACELPD